MTMIGNGWGSGMGLAALGAILLLAAVAAGVVLLVRYLDPASGRTPRRRPDPEDVLADRFAHGEIDEQEYRRRLRVLDEQDERPVAGG